MTKYDEYIEEISKRDIGKAIAAAGIGAATAFVNPIVNQSPSGHYAPEQNPQVSTQSVDQSVTDGRFLSQLKILLKKHEGYRTGVYKDTKGHPTIGIGFNLDKDGAREALASVGANYDAVRSGAEELDDIQIQALFNSDVNTAMGVASRFVNNWDQLPLPMKAVLADMSFNLGEKGLSKFKNFKAALEAGDYRRAAYEMKDSDWYNQVGDRSKHLVDIVKKIPSV